MTCIAGLVHDGKVYIGGDSAGVAGLDLVVRADRKVFENSGFLFGFTSSFRMGQLLRYSFKPPKHYTDDKDLYAYMVTDFIDGVRDCLKRGGYARKDSDAESGGTFLVGREGRLFEIGCDYQVGESVRPFNAVGCGQSYALGSFYSTEGMEPRARVEMALRAAAAHSGGVSPPFHIESI